MPIGSTPGLPVGQAAADQGQIARSLQQLQERAVNQVEADRSQDRGKEEASAQVQGTQSVEGATIQGESRGAHSFQLKKEEAERTAEPLPEEKPPDPGGRGTRLDIEI